MNDEPSADDVGEIVRVEGGRALATLTRLVGDWQVAEDCLADATVAALRRWPADGVPRSPAAWLVTVARNRARDHFRREARRRSKEADAVFLLGGGGDDFVPSDPEWSSLDDGDDTLRLIFTCCHPALAPATRIALSLKTVCGLTTGEVARVLLVSETTMAQRLVRAKHKIAAAVIPYRVPVDHELPERLPAVLTVLYSVFTAGHSAGQGDELLRVDLCDEAIRVTRLLQSLMPDEREVSGLLALELLSDARRGTRTDARGDLVLLADQDRSRWDQIKIGEGLDIVRARDRLPPDQRGPLAIQAAIAAEHATAVTLARTDWTSIVRLYDQLLEHRPTPIVHLNRAVALAEHHGAAAGLADVDRIEGLDRFHLFHATRAELLHRLGRSAEARDAFTQALACDPPSVERRFLERRLAECSPLSARS